MSLLERLNVPIGNGVGAPSIGPVRTKSGSRSSPYTRPNRPPKGDSDAQWSHDLYEDPEKPSLSSRLTLTPAQPRKPDSRLAQRALRDATGDGKGLGLSIKGASSAPLGNVVEVKGLVRGTSAADVEAIFKRCGTIVSSETASAKASENVIVRLTFKTVAMADAAVAKFNGQPADGKILQVSIVGTKAVGLSGRLAGVDVVDDSVDVLMEGGDESASKMRSDSIIASDPRASVLVAPPGADPKQYSQHSNSRADTQKWQRGGRGRGRGRGRRAGGGGGAPGMDIDD
ncbi:hypothetical protein DEU56DRAFT_774720 [Suillus clintonianus]|uniref:uncharacterized protein n=1 Tax=Suillus clintonianus TaxID=1904413 RepID=UPI001B86DA8A|nr:uncharacterized protein DEU56DRAFT_774720 [Suillus clintonianus]KAG2153343.1 hypothetical protein DEU56DRAFT_774720 [Suillus clintonianus]